ncbi:MAG: hypothetical protein WDK95_16045 [Syntrophorhabdaceae bacterium]
MTLCDLQLTFTQKGNNAGTTEPAETMVVSMLDVGDDPFFVLKSPTGWSIDDVAEIVDLLDRCYAAWRAASDEPVKEQ